VYENEQVEIGINHESIIKAGNNIIMDQIRRLRIINLVPKKGNDSFIVP
jgi:hypothetical protein